MATGRVPTTANSPLTTKGDLFTYDTSQARLAVGSNGETLVADSSTSTGLRYQETNAAGKNFVINGAFDVWQRGTSYTLTTTTAYGSADRWATVMDGTAAGTASQITSSLPSGFRYAVQLQRNTSSTNTNPIRMYQILETQNSIPVQGKVLTFSFWAKAGANYSAASSAMAYRVATGTGTDQSVTNMPGGALTGYTEIGSGTVTLTTSWQRFTITTSAAGSSVTQIGFGFFWTPTGTAGANDWVQITGVQLEIGSVATGFQRAMGTLAGELAACQRYYQEIADVAQVVGYGTRYNSTTVYYSVPCPVQMRTINPTASYSGTVYNEGASGNGTLSAPTVQRANPGFICVLATCSVTPTSGQVYVITYGKHTFSAEL